MSTKHNGNGRGLSLRAIEGQLVPEHLTYQAQLRQAVYDGVSADDVAEIVRQQVAAAKKGDSKAAAFVMAHVVGTAQKPPAINVTIETADTESAVRAAQALRKRGARSSDL